MGTFSALLAFCAGNSPVTGEIPAQGQWRRALTFSFICAWTNDWVNNGEAGELKHHRAHYDVTVLTHFVYQLIINLVKNESLASLVNFISRFVKGCVLSVESHPYLVSVTATSQTWSRNLSGIQWLGVVKNEKKKNAWNEFYDLHHKITGNTEFH